MSTTEKVVTAPKNEQVEGWLDSHALKYRAAKVSLADVNIKESLRNQAREDALTKPVVDKYADGMKNGDVFPPIVLYMRGAQYIVVDGNHRVSALSKYGATHVHAYVLDGKTTPPQMIELLTAEANTRHGQTVSSEWRNRQAVYLYNLGHTVEDVAKALVVSQTTVKNAVQITKTTARAKALMVPEYETLPFNVKVRVGALKADSVFQAVVKMLVETKFTGQSDVSKFVGLINRASTEKDALALVQEMYEMRVFDMQQQAISANSKDPKKRIANPKTHILTALGSVMALDPEKINRIFLTTEERSEIGRRFADASIKLMECEDVLRRA